MRRPTCRLLAAALALCLGTATRARAEFTNYSYNVSALTFTPDTPYQLNSLQQGAVYLYGIFPAPTNGQLWVGVSSMSNNDPSQPITYTHQPYSMLYTVLDKDSNKQQSFLFSGEMTGTLSKAGANFTNTLTSPSLQSKQIGNHVYTLQVSPFVPPNPMYNSFLVVGTITVTDAPEPSPLVLSGLCLALCGAGWWFKRGRVRFSAPPGVAAR